VVAKIFANGQFHVHRWILKKDPDLAPHGSGKLAKATTRDRDFTVLKSENSGNNFKKCRFATAVGAKDAEHAPFFEPKVNIFQNTLSPIGVTDPLRMNRT
jgi:hypothetical protein